MHGSFKRYPILLTVRVSDIEKLLKIIIKKRIFKLVFHTVKLYISLKLHKVKVSPGANYLFFISVVYLAKSVKIIYSLYNGYTLSL